jgi:amino acid adenylation domain-containing protein
MSWSTEEAPALSPHGLPASPPALDGRSSTPTETSEVGYQRLVAQLRHARRARLANGGLRPRPAGSDLLPLSHQQAELWSTAGTPGLSAAYRSVRFQLRGPVDPKTLGRAVDTVVERHEILRTRYETTRSGPVQRIRPAGRPALTSYDLRHLPAASRRTRAQRLLDAAAARDFALDRDLPVRLHLVTVAHDAHLLQVTLHMLSADGASVQIFLDEVSIAYRMFRDGRCAQLPSLPVQYGDIALHQQWSGVPGSDRRLEHWRTTLAGLAPLELPADRPRRSTSWSPARTERRSLSEELSAAVRALAQEQQVPGSVALLTAFLVLLHRYTGRDDLAVGTVVPGRTGLGPKHLIGLFATRVVLRVDAGLHATFADLLRRVQDSHLRATDSSEALLAHFAALRTEGRDIPGRLPTVSFTVEDALDEKLDLPDVVCERVDELGARTTWSDLEILVRQSSAGLSVAVEYAADLFGRERIARLITHFENVLRVATAGPHRPLPLLPVITDAERRRAVSLAPGPRLAYPRDRDVTDLIEEQLRRRPDAPAVVSAEGTLTYREIGRWRDRVAAHLDRAGVPGGVVAVRLRRDVPLIPVLLGVLKAGAAYLPLLPDLPATRVAALVSETAPAAVVADDDPEGLPAAVRPVTSTLAAIGDHSGGDAGDPPVGRGAPVRPDAPAYILYTSGSTGRPKGVVVPHRALTQFVVGIADLFDIRPGTRVLQFADPTFDVSVFEIFATLAAGGVLCVSPPGASRSPDLLARWLREAEVEVADLPPAVMERMPADGYPALRLLSVGGEAFSADLVNRWNLPGRRFLNTYGPTEATVITSWFECPHTTHLTPPPIGRATANHELILLDRYGDPVPVGIPGEIHIGGPGLALGYLADPALTADRFVPHQFARTPGARLYRTGDIGVQREDGAIVFLGRWDDQIRLRGQRIEPGEVEAALRRHRAVREAAVVVREDSPGARRLVAFTVGDSARVTGHELREWLERELPPQLVPASFEWLTEVPLTSSGKVDRRQLATMDLPRQTSFRLPETESERAVADVLGELLGVPALGADDDFFDLGGNSLLVTRATILVSRATGVELPLTAIYTGRTVAGLAAAVDRIRAGDPAGGTPPAGRVPAGDRRSPGRVPDDPLDLLVPLATTGRPLYFFHPSGGSVHCYAELARHLSPEIRVCGILAAGLAGQTPPDRLETMAQTYCDVLTRAQPEDPLYLAGWSMGGVLAFATARLLSSAGRRVAFVGMLDPALPPPGWNPSFADIVTMFATDLGGLLDLPVKVDVGAIASCPEGAERIRQAVRQLTGALPEGAAGPDLADRLRTFAANVQALASYRPDHYPGAVTVLHPVDQRTAAERWQALAASVTLEAVPGDHYSILRPPHLRTLVARLWEHLGATRTGAH